MVTACCFIVPMMWLKRLLMVILPANFDVVNGTSGSYHFTWIPIAVTLAALAAVPLMLMLLFRVVPLLSIDEIEEIEETEQKRNRGDRRRLPAGREASRRRSTPLAEPYRPAARVRVGSRRSGAVLMLLVLVALCGVLGPVRVGRHGWLRRQHRHRTPAADPVRRRRPGQVTLTAKVTDPKGAPLTAGKVTFELFNSVFGPRQVPLGTVGPDKTGTARLHLDGVHSNG